VSGQTDQAHGQVAGLLSAYIDGEVTADERAVIESHLATCADCQRDLTALRQTVALLSQLPSVAAPRPFTLRPADVAQVERRPADRVAWWQWVAKTPGVVAGLAALLCVVLVGGVLLMGRVGPGAVLDMAPAATSVAFEKSAIEPEAMPAAAEKSLSLAEQPEEAPTSTPTPEMPLEPQREEVAEESMMDAGGWADGEHEVKEGVGAEALPAASPTAVAAATAQPVAPAPAEAEQADRALEEPAAANVAPSATRSPQPTSTAIALLPVQDVEIEIQPGVILVSGRLPLAEGQPLLAGLWREGQLIEWATPESQRTVMDADGQFALRLEAPPATPGFYLFAVEPAQYEIRIRPVDPLAPVEARIPFDTFLSPSAE
jgi:hypothetical protein